WGLLGPSVASSRSTLVPTVPTYHGPRTPVLSSTSARGPSIRSRPAAWLRGVPPTSVPKDEAGPDPAALYGRRLGWERGSTCGPRWLGSWSHMEGYQTWSTTLSTHRTPAVIPPPTPRTPCAHSRTSRASR